MTALEAKEKADTVKQALFKKAFEKTVEYFNEQIEKIASEGGYYFYIYPNDEDLIEAIGEREAKEYADEVTIAARQRKEYSILIGYWTIKWDKEDDGYDFI